VIIVATRDIALLRRRSELLECGYGKTATTRRRQLRHRSPCRSQADRRTSNHLGVINEAVAIFGAIHIHD